MPHEEKKFGKEIYSKLMVRLLSLIIIVSVIYAPKTIALAAINASIYYVSPSGLDSNPGTLSKPWKTIQKAANSVVSGDTVYVRGGVYNESVELSHSGTSSAPITFLAYLSEIPVLDGKNYTIPSIAYGPLLKITGNYINVSGIEARYSRGMGVAVTGQHNNVSKINSHHNQENGILVSGDNNTIANSLVWSNCMSNNNGSSTSGWASGLSAARHPINTILTGNTVYGNWGEGLSTYEANGTIIKGNTVYDNWSANVYISDATNILVERNFVYATGSMTSGSQVGIMMGDEKYTPPSSNNKIINNIVYATKRNFYWWQGTSGGGLVDVTISNNTFVNSSASSGVQINSGSHVNTKIDNNLFVQDGSLPIIIAPSSSGLLFSNNMWSKSPPTNVLGSQAVVGDPKLSKVGSTNNPNWFRLTNGSPAIDKGATSPDVTIDYFGNNRGSLPDIGANEYNPVILNNRVYLPGVRR